MEERFIAGREEEGSGGPLPQVCLSEADLLTILLASSGNNSDWKPSQEIQISGYKVRSLPPRWKEIACKRYKIRQEGKGARNTILSPLKFPNDCFTKLMEKVSLDDLGPVIALVRDYFMAISSLILLPNTSLGVKRDFPYYYPRKINGAVIRIDHKAKKLIVQELLNSLGFPWGRTVLFGALHGIRVDDFIFGRDLIPSSLKFADFFYDNDGSVYLVLGGGGLKKKDGFDISGTDEQIEKRLDDIYSGARNWLLEIAEYIAERIGGGVSFEEVTSYAYVGYDPKKRIAFSGLPHEPREFFLLNPPPTSGGEYCLHKKALIGINPRSPVAEIISSIPVAGKPLSRVADFGV